ncbi:flavin-containing monooxygenase [Palleronia sp.]|uniref:flavin-containing monooxygenase n=1 Tax=Palleronia sp. TaxID=1940284 RepID=UPI0035C83E02
MAQAIVIGAGPGGLAVAAMLQTRAGLSVHVLERADRLGAAWHRHYDGLKLHTARTRSSLPGLPMPTDYPRFPTREQVVAYLDSYARHFALDIRAGATVERIAETSGGWRVEWEGGSETAGIVVVATGLNNQPVQPELPGFTGQVLHSSVYRRPDAFRGQRVLVVGLGNSGGDIAVQLAEAGIDVALSVRSPVNLVPKTLFGVPVTSLGLLRQVLGAKAADRAAAPLFRRSIGRPEDYGLRQHPKGPMQRLVEDGRVPLIDPGVLPLISAGSVAVRAGIEAASGHDIRFADGRTESFDAVIWATGYKVDLRPILGARDDVLDKEGRPLVVGEPTAARGLYFVGLRAAPEGQLRRLGIEAKAVAASARKLRVLDTKPPAGGNRRAEV